MEIIIPIMCHSICIEVPGHGVCYSTHTSAVCHDADVLSINEWLLEGIKLDLMLWS